MQYVLVNGSVVESLEVFEPNSSILLPSRSIATVQRAICNETNSDIYLSLESASVLYVGSGKVVGPNTILLRPQVSIYHIDLSTPLDGIYVCATTMLLPWPLNIDILQHNAIVSKNIMSNSHGQQKTLS